MVYGQGEDVLPRAGASMGSGERRALRLAEQLGLEADLIAVDRFGDLIPMLLEGKGDLIAARMSVTKPRREKVAFSRAVKAVDEVLVTRRGDAAAPTSIEGLSGKTVVVRPSSAYRETLNELIAKGTLKDVTIVDADPATLPGDLADGRWNSMTRHDWGYTHRPTPRQRITFPFPRGRVVGGSSAVNTCIALRPDRQRRADSGPRHSHTAHRPAH